MDKKELTDEEIVKALEHEKKHLLEEQERTGNAPDTQLVYITGNAVFEILDLIHRLQSEKKELQESADLFNDFNEKLTGIIEGQKAEIEQLTEEVKYYRGNYNE